MHFVPVIGDQGLFIPLGGITDGGKLREFEVIPVYDPAARKWYNVTTTGNNKPNPRVDFCAAGAPSVNNTWDIFIHGGSDGNLGNGNAFDTIHILSLPAFTWIQVPYSPTNPRHGMTCHGVGGSQILVVGGADSKPKVLTGDFNAVGRSKLESPDPFKQGLGVFDLTTLKWNDRYNSKPAHYTLSKPLQDYYASVKSDPSTANKLPPDIQTLVNKADYTRAPPGLSTLLKGAVANTTSSPARSTSRAPAIAGGVVGVVAAIALLSLFARFFIRRRNGGTGLLGKGGKETKGYEAAEQNSLEDMYKNHSRGQSPYQDEASPYVYKDGHSLQVIQYPGSGLPVEAGGEERNNIFEADGVQRGRTVHEAGGVGRRWSQGAGRRLSCPVDVWKEK